MTDPISGRHAAVIWRLPCMQCTNDVASCCEAPGRNSLTQYPRCEGGRVPLPHRLGSRCTRRREVRSGSWRAITGTVASFACGIPNGRRRPLAPCVAGLLSSSSGGGDPARFLTGRRQGRDDQLGSGFPGGNQCCSLNE